jgi:hypothetical protein
MFKLLFSAATGFLGGIQTYLIVGAVAAILAGFSAGYVVHRMDETTITSMKLAASLAEVDAVNMIAKHVRDSDKIVLDAAVKEAAAQTRIVTQTATLTKEIPSHVKDSSTCITFGLVRVLNAAATGASPRDTAPGQPDDACAGVSWRSLAGDLTDDYASGNANAEQLNALEDTVAATAAVGLERPPHSN